MREMRFSRNDNYVQTREGTKKGAGGGIRMEPGVEQLSQKDLPDTHFNSQTHDVKKSINDCTFLNRNTLGFYAPR